MSILRSLYESVDNYTSAVSELSYAANARAAEINRKSKKKMKKKAKKRLKKALAAAKEEA